MSLPRLAVPILLCLGLGLSAQAGLREELRTRCKTDADVERMLHDHFAPWVEQADNLSPDLARYLVLKHEGAAVPADLQVRLFPPAGGGARQGGETPAEATQIDGIPYNDTGTTVGYVNEGGTSYGSPDVFYSFTLEQISFITISLCGGTSYDSALEVFENADGALGTSLYVNDDACGLQSQLTEISLPAGDYFLAVDGFSSASQGTYTLDITEVGNPCEGYNDAVVEFAAPGTLSGSNVGATDVYGGDGGDAGITLTIPSSGLWNLDACQAGSSYDLVLNLFTDNPCEGGTLIASAGWSDCQLPWGAARLNEINLEAGTYHLMVSDDWTATGSFEIVIEPTPPRPTQGGPDEMGYVWTNSLDPNGPEFEWVDISETGTDVTLSDDSFAGPFDMGIDFPFYEDTYAQCWIGSNGYVSFTQGYSSLGAQPFPTPSDGWSPDNFIAPFWDDLWPVAPGSVRYLSDQDNERFIVQFTAVPGCCSDTNPRHTFQVILYGSGDYLVQYQDMGEGDLLSFGVGQENTDGTIGLQYRYHSDGGAVTDGVAFFVDALEGDFRPPVVSLQDMPSDVETELPGDYPVTATVTDETGLQSVTLVYTVNAGTELSVAMSQGANSLWSGAIPHQPEGSLVSWWLVAVDATELHNTRTTAPLAFDVVSYATAPQNLSASDGLQTGTLITWLPPPNIELVTLFGAELPTSEDEAVAFLMETHGMSKLAAASVWQRWLHGGAEREFESFRLYRDDELLVETTNLSFTDHLNSGSEADVVYTYSVSAVFTSGESDRSNEDQGSWSEAPSSGGPDAYGYIWRSSLSPGGPEYEWTDISGTGTNLGIAGDDVAATASLPFEFPWYGNFYSNLWVSSNGYLTFQATATPYWNGAIPDPQLPNDVIFAVWDDLYVGTNGSAVFQWNDTANERAIFQWNNVTPLGGSNPSTFQIILSASGLALLQYEDITETDVLDCSVGIEDASGTIGLQVNRDGQGMPIMDELALIFLPPSNCEPVECAGTAEVEPNEGWNDNNASFNVIRCGDTRCGTVLADGTSTDTDWYLYTHFGGNITVTLDVSDFNGRVSLREHAVDGQTLAAAGSFPRCFDEAFTVNDLPGGAYYIVVEHVGDPDVPTPQTYGLSLVCSGDPCSGHLPVECVGTPEVEPNDGWNATPPNSNYGQIALGQTICGAVWANAGQRDMDWYHFHLDVADTVTFTAQVDAFDAALFITDFNPAGSVLHEVNEAPACAPETITLPNLAAGDYFLAIGHSTLEGVEEPQAYQLVFGTPSQPEDPCDNYVDVGNFHDIVQMARPAPMMVHHDGTGCPGGISSPGRDEVTRLVLSQTTDLQVSMHGDGNADEVILLLGNCAQPNTSCGAAVNNTGAGTQGETLTLANVPAGDYFIVADFAGPGETHPYTMSIIDMESGLGEGREFTFAVEPNFPNPFNPSTSIQWTQPALAAATLTVHDLRGALVDELDLGVRGAGHHQVTWDATRFGSGVYFCTLSAGGQSHTLKAVLLK